MTVATAGSAMRLAEKTILGFIAGAAAAIGVVELVLLIIRVVGLATDGTTTVTGVELTGMDAAALVDASPLVSGATYDAATVTVEGLPAGARGLLIASAIAAALVTIAICAVLAWLCLRVFIGRPFVTSATLGIGIVGLVVIVGGCGASLLRSLADTDIIRFIGLVDPDSVYAFSMDLAPLGWGVALVVVAGAFELGQRMQRDTEGLV